MATNTAPAAVLRDARLRSLLRTRSVTLRRNQRQHAQRAARALLDLERRRDQQRAGRGQLVEVGEAREAEFVGAVHQMMRGECRLEREGLAVVGAARLDAPAVHVALLDQELDR